MQDTFRVLHNLQSFLKTPFYYRQINNRILFFPDFSTILILWIKVVGIEIKIFVKKNSSFCIN